MYILATQFFEKKCVSRREIGVPSVFTFVESWQLIASGIRTKETDELCPFASKMTLENATFGGQIFCKTPKRGKMDQEDN